MKLYGKKPVLERIKADPGSIRKLYLQKRTELSEIVRELKSRNMVFESVDGAWMDRTCGKVNTQGVVAEVEGFRYVHFDDIIRDCLSSDTVPVFLDGVTDPQNLGSIIRSLACIGGFSLVLPAHRSAMVNETVLRVASGGESFLRIAVVENIATTLR
ncbi:MAG: RNA methyltransferase substrate-binding domain-containing protein, partial [Candidatus Omnitrophica bacterium]|nr:RNA methyltransferase substrate-binding domain-containing protein [Candidatus Omnitrophota bacterium]